MVEMFFHLKSGCLGYKQNSIAEKFVAPYICMLSIHPNKPFFAKSMRETKKISVNFWTQAVIKQTG